VDGGLRVVYVEVIVCCVPEADVAKPAQYLIIGIRVTCSRFGKKAKTE
jgi:hypothetical protein